MAVNSVSFLTPTINSIRKSIRGIDDSYNNFWDILAELIQNSVDAINKKEIPDGNIKIVIDSVNKTIRVIDDGIGIEHGDIPILLSPFSTNKENDSSSIGEKGVGLKFVIFQSDKFIMKTRTKDEPMGSLAVIDNAKTWKKATNEEDLPLELDVDSNISLGTDILVSGIENDKLFNMSFETMKFIIRTKTAVGNVLNIFDNNENIKVMLYYTDINGVKYEEELPYKYWLPTENLKQNSKIDLSDFKNWLSEADRSDNEKRNKLKNKVIYETGEIVHNDVRVIKYWLCFVKGRDDWKKLSINDKLLSESERDDEEKIAEKNLCMHQYGIFTSVKGMPTGISINAPTTGRAGYWGNLFIILEDRQLKFDIGRKSINSAIQTMYQKHLKTIFNNITNVVSKYVAGEPESNTNANWERDDIVQSITNLPPLGSSVVNFEKLPNEQEASVAAIFYELIGSGKIDNIKPVISGYKDKYDLYAKYKNHFVIIEFKSHLRYVLRDFDDEVKLSNEIDYIVCWDVNDDDKSEMHSRGLSLEEIDNNNPLGDRENYIEYATHKIYIPTAKPVYVIDLKVLLSRIQKGEI